MQLDFYALLDGPIKENTAPPPANLAEAFDLYSDAASSHPSRVHIRSSFKVLSRGLGLPLDQISADPAKLRVQLGNGSAALAGVKPRSWISAKSKTLGALRALGVSAAASRETAPIGSDWQAVLNKVKERRQLIGLSRFIRFLSVGEISPALFTAADFERYHQHLLEHSIRDGAAASLRQTARLWNACRKAVPDWPDVELVVTRDARRFALDWEEFPPSFRDEVERFLEAKRNPDPLSEGYSRAVRADTDVGRRTMLRAMASALVLGGTVPVEEVVNLAVLTEIENVRSILRYMRDERFNGAFAPQHLNQAHLLRTIAKYWEINPQKAEALKALIHSIGVALGSSEGIKPKNRKRLTQFDDARNIDRLVGLPHRTLKVCAKVPVSHMNATRVMYALQVAILMAAPIRLKNLSNLCLGESLTDTGTGKNRLVRIVLSGSDTKTHADYTAPLPPRLYPLLDAWLSTYRPVICDQPSRWLFPNSQGQLRSRDSMSAKLSRFVERETGLVINTHLFRHLAAKLYLTHDPDGLEVVRQLLGHSSLKTTLKAYAEPRTDSAFKRLDAALGSLSVPSGRIKTPRLAA